MFELLCHEATFSRIQEKLKTHEHILKPVIMNDDGAFKAGWSGEPVETPNPQIVYGNTDVWFCAGVQNFVVATLQASDLKWFQSSAAGLEHPILQSVGAKAGIYTSGHEQAHAIAEWALWAAMDMFQRGGERREAQVEKKWTPLPFREIAGSHWLIIGFGAIGKQAAKRLRALGAEITGVRRTPGPDADADQMAHPDNIIQLLPSVDGVLLCCPITEETHHIANATFFRAMKPDAVLMNVGRGDLVDEAALITALNTCEFEHAALDVVSEEPLPESHPIWSHSKITLTAHTSGQTHGTKTRTDKVFLKNLDAFLRGDESAMADIMDRAAFETQAVVEAD